MLFDLKNDMEEIWKTVKGYNGYYQVTTYCEPQLGKRGLYPTISIKGAINNTRKMTAFIAYADGEHDLIDISNRINVPIEELIPIVKRLMDTGLIIKKK